MFLTNWVRFNEQNYGDVNGAKERKKKSMTVKEKEYDGERETERERERWCAYLCECEQCR